MARTPYKMKGSPHKMGTIEGTSTHKASMAKLAASEIPTAKVDMSRTSGDGTITAAFGEVGKSYIPAGIDYGLETKIDVVKSEGKGKKKKNVKKEKKNGEKKKVVIPREEDEIKVDGANNQAHWQSGGGFGERNFIDPAHKAPEPRKKIRVKGQPYTGKEVRNKKSDAKEFSWSEYM